ncbi:hypothetical protein ACWA2B_24935 [Paenibacillus sp. CMM36]
MKYTDDELKPLYDLWFSRKDLVLTIKDDWGLTPIDFAKKLPYKKNILERMEANVKREES